MRFILLCLATAATGAAGYIINDYLDVKLDLINKPLKVVVGQQISRRWSMFLHFLLNVLALICGYYIGDKVTLCIALAALLLWIYSVSLKRAFLSGNLLVAGMSAFVLLIIYVYNTAIDLNKIVAYSIFAFLLSLIREIVKDAEDIRGDGKFDCKTLPIVLGIRKTKEILFYTGIVLLLSIFTYTSLQAATYPFQMSFTRGGLLFYMLAFVCVPLGVLLYLIRIADTTSDFHRLSSFCKLIMLTGMLSMVFWKL